MRLERLRLRAGRFQFQKPDRKGGLTDQEGKSQTALMRSV